MTNGPSYFEIQADDTQRAIGFYSKIFGWAFEEVTGLQIPYWRIETGTLRGGLMQRPAKAPAPGSGTNGFVCSIEVADFDAMTDAIVRGGGKIAMPKFAVPGTCWQGYFIDTEGNVFGLFQPDEKAA
jgi:uncharacterized protein